VYIVHIWYRLRNHYSYDRDPITVVYVFVFDRYLP